MNELEKDIQNDITKLLAKLRRLHRITSHRDKVKRYTLSVAIEGLKSINRLVIPRE